MAMFLKNPLKRCQSRQQSVILCKTIKFMVFEILTFDFYLEKKKQLFI